MLSAQQVWSGRLIVKVKPEYRTAFDSRTTKVDALLHAGGVTSVSRMFPQHQAPRSITNNTGDTLVDLSLLYLLELPEVKESYITSLTKSGYFCYAEPWYIPELTYVPDDTMTGSQFALPLMKMFQAWDINKGDTSVIIGITDTGIDMDHPDLAGSIAVNYADPVNGVDDDNDGYTDNYRGWDVGENDNDPSSGANHHGVHVSGIAGAVTDNTTGIAGAGFRSRIMPVKIANAAGILTHAYQGVVYAADHGCRIINISWGGTQASQFARDIMNYATINKNALVVAACGNNNNAVTFYPAGYESVLAVAGTDSTDKKSITSNFGFYVDVSAPGWHILSTWDGGNYSFSSGTSMAAPFVCGAAALVAAQFPQFNALQIGEQLRVTADNIYVQNPGYLHKLGSGRINCYRALTDTTVSSVRVKSVAYTDHADDNFQTGDTIQVDFTFINYLAPSGALTGTVEAISSYLTVTDATTAIPALGMLDTVTTDPVKFLVGPNVPRNEPAEFRLTVTGQGQAQVYYFTIDLNTDYYHVLINDVYTTLTGKGRIGYYGTGGDQGYGFSYKDEQLLFEAGLVIGAGPGLISDAVRSANGYNDDFYSYIPIHRGFTAASDLDLFNWFNDYSVYNEVPLGLDVAHRAYAWDDPGYRNFIIVRYLIMNTGNEFQQLDSLYAGIFADWDIGQYSENSVATDSLHNLGYAWYTAANGKYAGIKLLAPSSFNHHAINLSQPQSVNLQDGFSDAEKYVTLSTGFPQTGNTGPGSDIAHMVSAGPFSLGPGDTVEVCFAVIAADSLEELLTGALAAQEKYEQDVPLSINQPQSESRNFSLFPNPATGSITLRGKLQQGTFRIFDITGRLVYARDIQALKGDLAISVAELTPGMYIYTLTTGKEQAGKGRLIIR